MNQFSKLNEQDIFSTLQIQSKKSTTIIWNHFTIFVGFSINGKISLFYNFFWNWILKLSQNHSQDLFPECELLVLSAMLGVDNDRAAQPLDAGRLSFAKANQYWQKRGKMRAKRIKG